MNLRIARKMDMGAHQRRKRDDRDFAKRTWWKVYSLDQLKRAERRLHRSWIRMCPVRHDDEGKGYRLLTPDYFAENRVNSRRIRQRTLRQLERGKHSSQRRSTAPRSWEGEA